MPEKNHYAFSTFSNLCFGRLLHDSFVGNLLPLIMALGFAAWVLSNLESSERKGVGSSLGVVILLGLLLFTFTLWTIGGAIEVARLVFS